MEVVASLSQGRTAAAQCGLFTHKSVPVIFEPPCSYRKSKAASNSPPLYTLRGIRAYDELQKSLQPESGSYKKQTGKLLPTFLRRGLPSF